jgi:hypothetical protein
VPTASGDSVDYVARFYRAFSALDCQPADLQLFHRTVLDLESFVLAQDVIYVGGGNTANLAAVWRVHGLDDILRRAWEQGVVLCGLSAGMNCWFSDDVRAVPYRHERPRAADATRRGVVRVGPSGRGGTSRGLPDHRAGVLLQRQIR